MRYVYFFFFVDDEMTLSEPELLKHIDPALKGQIERLIGRSDNLEIAKEIGRGLFYWIIHNNKSYPYSNYLCANYFAKCATKDMGR